MVERRCCKEYGKCEKWKITKRNANWEYIERFHFVHLQCHVNIARKQEEIIAEYSSFSMCHSIYKYYSIGVCNDNVFFPLTHITSIHILSMKFPANLQYVREEKKNERQVNLCKVSFGTNCIRFQFLFSKIVSRVLEIGKRRSFLLLWRGSNWKIFWYLRNVWAFMLSSQTWLKLSDYILVRISFNERMKIMFMGLLVQVGCNEHVKLFENQLRPIKRSFQFSNTKPYVQKYSSDLQFVIVPGRIVPMLELTITHGNVDCYQIRGVICTQSVLNRYMLIVEVVSSKTIDFTICCFVCVWHISWLQ